MEKIKGCVMEDVHPEEHSVSYRPSRLNVRKEEKDDDGPVERRLKHWVKQTLGSAPWVAIGVILFAMFAQGAVATAALMYGLMKVAIAVLLTVLADSTMFRGLRDPRDSGWLPMMRRSMVFLGIAWLMAVT